MLRIGTLSAFASGLVVALCWLAAATLWWLAPGPLMAIAPLGAVLLSAVLSQAERIASSTRRGAAIVGVFGITASLVVFDPRPLTVLLSISAAVLFTAGVTGGWHLRSQRRRDPVADGMGLARGAVAGAVLTVMWLAAYDQTDLVARTVLTGSMGWTCLLLTRNAARALGRPGARLARRFYLAGAILSAVIWLPFANPNGAALIPLGTLLAGTLALSRTGSEMVESERERFGPDGAVRAGMIEWLTERPSRALVVSFAVTAVVGGIVLALPMSAGPGIREAGRHGVAPLDALFTAFSAICVTGLVVIDTPNDLSTVGHVVVLVLIQLGGLGIMTFSTATLTLLGRRMSLRQEATAARLANVGDRREIGRSLGTIIRGTLVAEAIGALILTLAFVGRGEALAPAAWRGLFTAVSAFCNAGFALQSDSLIGHQDHPLVLLTCAGLILLGGIGPLLFTATIQANLSFGRRKGQVRRPLQLHGRLALQATFLLVVVGTGLIALFEWHNTLEHLPIHLRLSNALFQAISFRTAGFNSVDGVILHPATIALVLPLMFIGGCPGSTAGGIKTTTFALLLLNVRTTTRGDEVTVVHNSTIAQRSMRHAVTALLLGLSMVFVVCVLLLLTQRMSLQVALFEAVSAVGTVGLSIGGTAALDEVGKVIVIAAMFLGRIGHLTLLLALGASLRRRVPAGRYPEANIEVA